jgi:uncharacterized protein (TIGR02271 family)
MAKTLVGAFDDASSAQAAVRDLQASGVRSNHIRMMSGGDAYGQAETGVDHRSWADKVSAWFTNLFDSDDDRRLADDYAEAYRRGSYLVIADVDDTQVDPCIAIMNRYGNVDLSRRAEQWRAGGYTGFDRNARPYTPEERQRELASYQQGNVAVPVVQEELTVGKRVVQRGGVRVHSYVQERPVEENVRLREERIDVQRRPANRAATGEDLAFKNRSVDVTAVGEEPIVQKQARVVEEVVVGKHVEQRDEKVRDKVRRKDVQVEPISSRRGNVMPESQRHHH